MFSFVTSQETYSDVTHRSNKTQFQRKEPTLRCIFTALKNWDLINFVDFVVELPTATTRYIASLCNIYSRTMAAQCSNESKDAHLPALAFSPFLTALSRFQPDRVECNETRACRVEIRRRSYQPSRVIKQQYIRRYSQLDDER